MTRWARLRGDANGKNKALFPCVIEVAHRDVVQTSGQSTVAQAIELMEAHDLSDVVFQDGAGYAIFTVDDLLRLRQHGRSFGLRLQELSLSRLTCVSGDENVLQVLDKFDEAGGRYLGVLGEDGQLIGVTSHTDVLTSVDPALMMERRRLVDMVAKWRVQSGGTQHACRTGAGASGQCR